MVNFLHLGGNLKAIKRNLSAEVLKLCTEQLLWFFSVNTYASLLKCKCTHVYIQYKTYIFIPMHIAKVVCSRCLLISYFSVSLQWKHNSIQESTLQRWGSHPQLMGKGGQESQYGPFNSSGWSWCSGRFGGQLSSFAKIILKHGCGHDWLFLIIILWPQIEVAENKTQHPESGRVERQKVSYLSVVSIKSEPL
jgi:hypothetical protein